MAECDDVRKSWRIMAFMHDKILFGGAVAMAFVVALSNYLVRFPFPYFEEWLTWAAWTFPIAFLITDCINRTAGAAAARKIVVVGFAVGVPLSFWFSYDEDATAAARIALASGAAFMCAQLLDVKIFNRILHFSKQGDSLWWLPPAVSSAPSSVLDTFLFFGLAFAGTGVPWMQWAVGDLAVKILMILLLLPPYRFLSLQLQTRLQAG